MDGEAPPRQRGGGSEGRRGKKIDVNPIPIHESLAGIGDRQSSSLNPDTIILLHIAIVAGLQQRADLPLGLHERRNQNKLDRAGVGDGHGEAPPRRRGGGGEVRRRGIVNEIVSPFLSSLGGNGTHQVSFASPN